MVSFLKIAWTCVSAGGSRQFTKPSAWTAAHAIPQSRSLGRSNRPHRE